MTFDAFWPPRLAEHGVQERALESGVVLRVPALTAQSISALCVELAERTLALRKRNAAEISTKLARAAGLLTQRAEFCEPALDLIPRLTGYSPEMTRYVLQRMARDWSADALATLLVTELRDPAVLDTFVTEPAALRRIMAIGPRVTAHIFSGNVPGVAVTSLIRALLVKSASFGKTAVDEPVLPVLFARALADVDEALANALVITHWPGGTPELDGALIEQCDTIVVYGGASAIEAVRGRAQPDARVVLHGPKISLGVLGCRALDGVTARAAARAVATFDQQGCVSPHVIYVAAAETDVREFARTLAAELRTAGNDLPRGRLSAAEAMAIQQARASAEFRAISGAEVELHADDALSYTVVYEREPAFHASCLNRFVYVKPLADVRALPALLAPYRPLLQSVAVEGFTADETTELAAMLAQTGVSRIATFADLPWPTPQWHHDGKEGGLRELLEWCEIQIPSPASA